MRGTFNHIRGPAHTRAFHFVAALQEIREELAVAISRLSAWAEWRQLKCGLGIETTSGNLQIWFGRLDLIFCIEPRPTSAEVAK